MARRKTKDPEFSLFPFLSVLVSVMGTLILIITGMTQIGLASPKQRVDIDPFDPGKKNPVYAECRGDGLLLHPEVPGRGEPVLVERDALSAPTSAWSELLTKLQYDPTRYVQLLVRSNGVSTFHAARRDAEGAGVDVGYEPLFGSGEVQFQRPRRGR